MSLSKRKKILLCVISALLAIVIAIGAVAIVLIVLKNTPQNDEYIYSDVTTTVVENITEFMEQSNQIEQTKENTIHSDCSPVDTSTLTKRQVKIPVKYILQNPELPTGCEITSLTMALKFYGYNVSKTDMADRYLQKSGENIGDFWEVFVGNPRSNGFGCYAKPIVNAANKYFKYNNGQHKALNLSGTDFENLLKKVQDGTPVIIWSTMYGEQEKNLREPFKTVKWNINGKEIQWISPEHCMLLIGYDLDRNVAIMADPQRGIVEYDLFTVKSRYISLHSQCVVIENQPFIEGVKDGDIYYTTQYVDFADSIKSITVNGEEKTEMFFINGDAEQSYKIVANDSSGNVTVVTIHTKSIMSILDPIKNVNENNVTEEHRQLIKDIKTAVLELNTDYATPSEQNSINKAISYCDKLLNKLDSINTSLEQIKNNLNKLSFDGIDGNDIDATRILAEQLDDMLVGKNLTSEQRIIAGNLRNKCQDIINSTPPQADDFN